jgi:hypothetical protein
VRYFNTGSNRVADTDCGTSAKYGENGKLVGHTDGEVR